MKDPNNPNCNCPCHKPDSPYCVCGCRVHYGTHPKDAENIITKPTTTQQMMKRIGGLKYVTGCTSDEGGVAKEVMIVDPVLLSRALCDLEKKIEELGKVCEERYYTEQGATGVEVVEDILKKVDKDIEHAEKTLKKVEMFGENDTKWREGYLEALQEVENATTGVPVVSEPMERLLADLRKKIVK